MRNLTRLFSGKPPLPVMVHRSNPHQRTAPSDIFAPRRWTATWVAAATAIAASLPSFAHAEQFVLFDATFVYTWEDALNSSPSESHYYVTEDNWLNVDRPQNWVSPVNYRDGSVHIRVEVLDKPAGDQPTGWALCYIANVGSYGCPYSDYYTGEGIYERDVAMNDFWMNAPITWEQGIKQVDLVYTIDDSGSGKVHSFPELSTLTTPTEVRITMVQVSEGDTYDASILEPTGTGGSDAGSGGASTGGTGGTSSGAGGAATAGTGGGNGSPVEPSTGGSPDPGASGGTSTTDGGNGSGTDSEGGCAISSAPTPGSAALFMGMLAFFAAVLARKSSRRTS